MTTNLNQPPKRICLGKITGPHGVKGLVKILPYGDDLSLIGEVYTSETGDEILHIHLKNPIGRHYLAEIEGINSREAAEELVNTEFYIDRENLPATEDDTIFYCEDLVGLRALDHRGDEYGTVLSVQNFGAGDLLEIRPKSGDVFLLPFNETFVPEINLEQGFVSISDEAETFRS